MEYSRNMTIIENGYKKLKEQKAQRAYVSLRRISKLKKPTKTKNLSHVINIPQNLLQMESVTTETKSKTSTNTKDTEFEKLPLRISQSEKKIEFQNLDIISAGDSSDQQNASYWMVNPDKLDLTLQEPMKPVRRQSMGFEPNFRRETEHESGNLEDFNLTDDNKNEEENLRNNKYIDNARLIEENNDKKKVIHRRIIYFDKQSNDLNHSLLMIIR